MIETPRGKNDIERLNDLPVQAEKHAREVLLDLANKNNLFFHDLAHTQAVVSRYKKIVKGFEQYGLPIDAKEKILGEVGAWFHDVVQDFEVDIKKETFVFLGKNHEYTQSRRKRSVGPNEDSSAKQAIEFLSNVWPYSNFTQTEAPKIKEQIMTTVPRFDREKIVIQENLTENSQLIDFALALADLGTSGMEPEKFVTDGDKLFMEDNLDILNAIVQKEHIDEARSEYFRSRMIDWCQKQVEFPTKRKAQVREDLGKIKLFRENPDMLDKFIQEFFPGFEQAKKLVVSSTLARQRMDFETLVKDMGYNL